MTNGDVVLDGLRDRYVGGAPKAPASEAQVREAEQRLGFAIPQSLRRLYVEFSNGGFGPACGIYGVGPGAYVDLDGLDLVGQYFEHRQPTGAAVIAEDDPEYALWTEGWPEHVLPLTPAGTLSYVIDALTGEVFSADGDDIVSGMTYRQWFQRVAPTIEVWLDRWLSGEELPRGEEQRSN